MDKQNTSGEIEKTPYLKSCVFVKGDSHVMAEAMLLLIVFTFSVSIAKSDADSKEDSAEDASVLKVCSICITRIMTKLIIAEIICVSVRADASIPIEVNNTARQK